MSLNSLELHQKKLYSNNKGIEALDMSICNWKKLRVRYSQLMHESNAYLVLADVIVFLECKSAEVATLPIQ